MSDLLAVDPVQRSANIRLGLALGGFVVLVVIGLMFLFARQGLPKSPEIWKEMEQERSAGHLVLPSQEPAAMPSGEESR